MPVHTFVAAGAGLTFRVTTASSDEAALVAQVNADRASQAGVGPLTFDEPALEAARQHVSEMNGLFVCHFNTANQGPQTRLSLLGELGLTGENINGSPHFLNNYNGAPQNEPTTTQIWHGAEASWIAEKASSGPHLAALSASNATSEGVAVATITNVLGETYSHQGVADLEAVIPSVMTQQGSFPFVGCPASVTASSS